jgi:hypothetical protein
MEAKTLFPLLWYIQRYSKMYQKPYLILNKYAAEIQLPGNGVYLVSVPQMFYTEF